MEFLGWLRWAREERKLPITHYFLPARQLTPLAHRGGIRSSRHCRRQCKIFASSVNFSIFTHLLCFFLLKLLKLGEIDGVKFLA